VDLTEVSNECCGGSIYAASELDSTACEPSPLSRLPPFSATELLVALRRVKLRQEQSRLLVQGPITTTCDEHQTV